MDYKMNLTQEELDILNGSKGEAMAKVMKTLVMYGDAFGATKMVPVTSKMGHLVTSFGLKVMKPVYDLMDQLIAGGALFGVFAAITRFCGFEYDSPLSEGLTQILGCVAYVLLIGYLYWDSTRAKVLK